MTELKSRLNSEADFQDDRVSKGGSYRKFQHLIRDEYPYFLEVIGDVKGKSILTMGCSTGGVTPFAKQGAWTVGVDISQLAIHELNQSISEEGLSSKAIVTVMNCEELAFKEESFDIVLFIGVLHHLKIEDALAESFRVLKPGGKVFMAEPLGLHPIVNLYRKMTPGLRTSFEHPLKPKDFRLMKKYFNIEEIKSFCLTSILSLVPLYVLRSDKIYDIARKFLVGIDNFLFKTVPVLKYCAWSAVVVLKKD